MNLKKLLITCIAGITIIGTSIIPSVEVKAATSSPICQETVRKGENHIHRLAPVCPRCGDRIYPGQNHVCSWSAYKENDEVNAEICIYCGMVPAPGRPHKCIYPI
ncbi:hypothetical protein [Clostridium sp. Marseille-Q7071]